MFEIIYSNEILGKLETEFTNTSDSLQIISAYCKSDALAYVDSYLTNKTINKRLMVRFRLEDILFGATDLSIYPYCKDNGWDIYMRLDLHAKTFVFDCKRWIVGSANLTSSGIGLNNNSNMEMAILADVPAEEMKKINTLFDKSTKMDDNLFALMSMQLEGVKDNKAGHLWNDEITNLLKSDFCILFTQDFPKSASPRELCAEDIVMLQLSGTDISLPTIKKAFIYSNCYLWLKNILAQSENKKLYFGSLSEKLHNILINDPKPYRKEIKELLANLLNWVTELEIDEILVERPNYSQLVKLI